MIKRILFFFMLAFSHLSVSAGITDGKFGINQIFDVQYWWNGTTLNASNFIAPYNMNFQTVTATSGQYFQFFPSTTNPGTYGLGLYNSNGTLAQVVHNHGDITALGNGAIFYIGSGFFGNVISTAQGYNYGASAQFTNMDTSVTASDLSNYTFASTTPLAAGQTAAPTAPVVTVTGTSVTYTTRTVVSGNTTTVYRTPVTTTAYSDGTTTSANGTEALYQTRVASTVVTNKIVGTTLTTYSTPINTVTTVGVAGTAIESNGAVVTTTQTVQQGLTYQVWRYDYRNYSCGIFGCVAIPFSYRIPSTNANDYGNTVRNGVTSGGMYLQTNARLPNGDGSLFTYNDGTVIRYTGTITAPITTARPAGTVYRLYFYNQTDDGFVLRINGGTIINNSQTDQWQAIGGNYNSNGWIDVVAGQTYNLEAWYWNVLGGVGHRFFWDYGDGIKMVPNSAFTTGVISAATIDTTGVVYSNSSVVNISGTTVVLGPTVEGGTITQNNASSDQVITSGSNSSAGITNAQDSRVNTWNNGSNQNANNYLYIDQVSGSYNDVTITQTTSTGKNKIEVTIGGTGNNVINATQSGTNYLKLDVTGNNNSVTSQQSNNSLTSNYKETTVNGNSNIISTNQKDNSNHIMFTTVTGNSNSVTAVQEGTGGHYLENKLTGNNNSVLVNQSGNTKNNATIDLTNNGGAASVDLQQSGGKSFSIIQSCTNPAGCSTVVRQ
jgi:hypothetical protein